MKLRIFANNVKHNALYVLFVFLVATIASATLSTFVLTTEAAKLRVIESTAKVYGTYHIMLTDIDNQSITVIDQQDYIESYSAFRVQYHGNMYFYYGDAKLLYMLGNQVTFGAFPSNPTEIMLEKNYVFSKYGADYENLIGEEIEIEGEAFVLSGIYQNQSLSSLSSCFLQADTEHPANNAAIVFDDNVNIDKATSLLLEATGEHSHEKVIKNTPLYNALGYGEDGQKQTAINATIIIVLASILFFVSGIIANNIIDICIDHNLKAISIYKLLCNSSKHIIIQLLSPLFIMMILGVSLGYFIAQNLLLFGIIECSNIAIRGTNLYWVYCVPLYIFILFFCILSIFIKIRSLDRMSDISVCRSSKLICINHNLPRRKNKIIFTGSSLTKQRFMYHISAANSGVLKTAIIVMGLSFSIVIGVLLLYLGTDTNDNNYNYDYQLIANSYDYMDTSIAETNRLTIERLKAAQDACKVIEQRQVRTHVNVDKTFISNDYKSLLTKYSQYGNRVRDNFNRQINLPAIVIGYSNETLMELGIDSSFDCKHDCIVFNSSASSYGVNNVFDRMSDQTVILKYDEFTDASSSIKGYEINIKQYISTIMYPVSYSVDTLVFIISNELFDELYPDTPVSNYYIVATKTQHAKKTIQDIIGGSTSMQIIDQEESNLENERNQHIANVVFGTLFLIVLAFSFVNVYSLFSLNFRQHIEIYMSYLAMGVRKSQLLITFVVNAIKYFVLSIPTSFLGLLLAIHTIREILYSYQAEYYLSFPMIEYLSFVGIVLALLTLTILFVSYKMNALNVSAHSISAD